MLGETKGPEEPVGQDEKPDNEPADSAVKPAGNNQAEVKNGVMHVTIYLENSDTAFACAIGSLVLAQDLVKNYFTQKAMAEAAIKARATMNIIKPVLSN